MKRSDLFLLYKLIWELVGAVSLALAIFVSEHESNFLALAGIAILWAILMKMEEWDEHSR